MTRSGLQADHPRIMRQLKAVFGIQQYRPHQQQAIQAVLEGRDVLLTMPTGAGKSLAYQLPAIVLEGLTLVISPLVALMKDQVDALCHKGVAAACVNATLDAKTRKKILRQAVQGQWDLLYITPERFRSRDFLTILDQLSVTRLAVDEAHCISQWGHDFRPDYSRLGEYRSRLGNPPTLALTATATPQVAADIIQYLQLQNPLVVRTGLERENLFLAATRVYDEAAKLDRIEQLVRHIPGPGIVYAALIRDLVHLHDQLRQRGINSLLYHGDLSARDRKRVQDQFMHSDDALILATNAFGMGIDKPDIRRVIHAQIPRTFEAWIQEVGRAGRDGAPAWCELLYMEDDLAIQQNFIQWANPSRDFFMGVYQILRDWGDRIVAHDLDDLRAELLYKNRSDNRVSICLKWLEVLKVTQGSFEHHNLRLVRDLDDVVLPASIGSEEKYRADLMGLLSLMQFATSDTTCRRKLIAEYFQLEDIPERCCQCDVCVKADESEFGR